MTERIEERASLTGRALWITCAKALAFAFSFALPLLLVRHLDQREFGLYKQVFLVVGTGVTLLPFGFAMSAFYFFAREPERRRQVALNILVFNAAVGTLACLVLVLRPSLLASIFGDSELTGYAPLVGVAVLTYVVSSFLDYVVIAHQEVRLATVFIVAAQLTKTTLLLAAALLSPTVLSLVYAAIAQGILQTLILLGYLRSRFPGFWRSFEWDMLRQQLSYALPLGFAGVLYYVQLDLHNYVVSYSFDAATFAVYSIGCFQLPLVGILGESVNSVLIPRVSYLQKQGQQREIVLLLARVMRKLAAVYFPLYVFLLTTGREFITVLFTPRYLESWPVFAVNLTMLPLGILMFDSVTRAYSELRHFTLKVNMLLVAVMAIQLWLGTRWFGLVGAIATVVLVNFSGRAATAIRLARVIGFGRRDAVLFRDIGKIGAAALAAGGVTWLARAMLIGLRPLALLVLCGGVYATAYAAAAVLLGVPTAEERAYFRRQLGRARATLNHGALG